jgi:hypothetical protein
MPAPFHGFDLSDFWDDSPYARKEYQDVPVTDALVAEVEAELGFVLPASYVALMRNRNGGCPRRTCVPTAEPTSWADEHAAITGLSAIGRTARYSLCGELGSRFMQREWGYPEFGICIADCPSAGHDMVMLDYRECGPAGEPQVVHVDQEDDFRVTFLAKDFEAFIRALVDEELFSEDGDILFLGDGPFSTATTHPSSSRSGSRRAAPLATSSIRRAPASAYRTLRSLAWRRRSENRERTAEAGTRWVTA